MDNLIAMNYGYSKKVFTLVELIIVIAIVSILSLLAFLFFNKWINKARDSRRLSDLYSIQTALNVYYYEHSNYSIPGKGVNIYDINGDLGMGTGYVIGVEGVFDSSASAGVDTLKSLPTDPKDGSFYIYTLLNVGAKGIEIGTTLEQPTLSYTNKKVYASEVSTKQPYMVSIYNDQILNYMDLPYLSLFSSDVGFLSQDNLGSTGTINIVPSTKELLSISGTYANTGNTYFLDDLVKTDKPFWTIHKISAGGDYVCSLSYSGVVSCWGANRWGELGDNSYINRNTMFNITGYLFKDINTSLWTTCGITDDGQAVCWGRNDYGQVGTDISSVKISYPTTITGGLSFKEVKPGVRHTCGITTDNKGYCWGTGLNGALGNGAYSQSSTPVLVSDGYSFKSISAGNNHSCGVTTDGKGYCWGWNNHGQLGNNSTLDSPVPVEVLGSISFSSIYAGNSYSCGLTSTGIAYCWGSNGGKIGDGTSTDKYLPTLVSGGYIFKSIYAYQSSCGITITGSSYCWGANQDGRLGDGTTLTRTVPTLVQGGLTFQSITMQNWHTCGITSFGKGYCWGNNQRGQLGDQTVRPSYVPLLIRGQTF